MVSRYYLDGNTVPRGNTPGSAGCVFDAIVTIIAIASLCLLAFAFRDFIGMRIETITFGGKSRMFISFPIPLRSEP